MGSCPLHGVSKNRNIKTYIVTFDILALTVAAVRVLAERAECGLAGITVRFDAVYIVNGMMRAVRVRDSSVNQVQCLPIVGAHPLNRLDI